MNNSVTHVAAPKVHLGERIIQRCAVCGEKLLDNLNVAMPIGKDGKPPKFRTWKERTLVHVEGGHSTSVGDFVEVEFLPPDFCISLVE